MVLLHAQNEQLSLNGQRQLTKYMLASINAARISKLGCKSEQTTLVSLVSYLVTAPQVHVYASRKPLVALETQKVSW